MTEKLCHCGRALHYSSDDLREAVESLITRFGTRTEVYQGGRCWLVQRHYIALHGLKAAELPTLGFEEIRRGAHRSCTPKTT